MLLQVIPVYILNECFKFIAISDKILIHKKYTHTHTHTHTHMHTHTHTHTHTHIYISFSGIFTVLILFVLNNCNKDVSPVIETHLINACKTLEMMCYKNNMVTQSHHVSTISIEL